jgi:hypothetical protein
VHVDQFGASSRSWTRENAPPAVTDWLRPVTHQQHLRTHLGCVLGDAIQGERAGEEASSTITSCPYGTSRRCSGGLATTSPCSPSDAEVIGEDLRGDRGRGEADDAAAPVLAPTPCAARASPLSSQRRPGRPAHRLPGLRPRRRERCGLVGGEESAVAVGRRVTFSITSTARCGHGAGALEESIFCREDFVRVHRRRDRPEPARVISGGTRPGSMRARAASAGGRRVLGGINDHSDDGFAILVVANR